MKLHRITGKNCPLGTSVPGAEHQPPFFATLVLKLGSHLSCRDNSTRAKSTLSMALLIYLQRVIDELIPMANPSQPHIAFRALFVPFYADIFG